MSKDSSAEDLDEEIAQLEEELAELEGSDDSKEEKQRSLKDRVPFLGSSKSEEEDGEQEGDEEDTDSADQEEGDGGAVSRIMGRFKGGKDDQEETVEGGEEEQSDDEESYVGGSEDPLAQEDPPPEAPQDEEPTEEEEPPALEEEPMEAREEDTAPPVEPSAASKRESDRWVKTPDGWKRREAIEEPLTAEDDEEDDTGGARALLSRFKKGEDEPDGEPPEDAEDASPPEEPEDDEDEEKRRPILLAGGILLALLLIAAIGAAAIWLMGGGEALQAQLSSDAFEQDGILITATGAPIVFDASQSTGNVEAYAWDFGDGSTTTTEDATTTHTYQERGKYTVTITLEGTRASDQTTRDVRVVDAPEATPEILLEGTPVAEPGTVGNNVFLGDRVTLDATSSTTDEDQEITTYEWDVTGDGSPDATGAETTTTFDEPGAWEVQLTVTDDIGHTDTATAVVHVGDVHVFQNETMPAPSPGDEDQAQTHETSIDLARLGAQPVQIEAVLTYGTGNGDNGLIEPSLEADLDLRAISPDGTTYEAEGEDAGGEETLTLSSDEIDSLGAWAWEVTRDTESGLTGAVSEVEYTLVVHVRY